MPTDETIVGDPVEYINNRDELGLDELGLSVRDADWGDSEVELFLIRQRLGEVPADRHPSNRTVTITIKVEEKSGMSLAEAAIRLQQKVGTWQVKGGWIGRVLDSSGGYARPKKAFIVHGANLGGMDGWLMAHRRVAPDVVLTLTTSPYCYDSQEVEAAVAESSVHSPHVIWELAQVHGTAPGLLRVKNENESEDGGHFKGMICAAESWDHPQDSTKDSTADLEYGTKLEFNTGLAEEKEREGAKVLTVSGITSGWKSIISSKNGESFASYMTHKGVRRPWIRVWDPGEVPGNVEVRLRWRPLGGNNWVYNKAQPTKVVDDWCLLDMQECRLQEAIQGEQRWEWELQFRANDGAGTLDFHMFYPLPTEQFTTIDIGEQAAAPQESDIGLAAEAEEQAGPGYKQEWSDDNKAGTVAGFAYTMFGNNLLPSEALKSKKHGLAVPSGATVTGVIVGIKRAWPLGVEYEKGFSVADVNKGIQLYLDEEPLGVGKSNPGAWAEPRGSQIWTYYGGSEDLWGMSAGELTHVIANDEDFGVRMLAQGRNVTAAIYEVSIEIFWTEQVDENVVCYSGRAMEIGTDRCIREHPEDDVWGMMTPDFFPWAEPSGMEGRAMRGIVIPSRGSLVTGPDHKATEATACASRVFYRAAYHFSGEGV